ncbi:Anthranilate 1,2-dioxygenase ferredoxin subunit [Planctomycetes bacterium Poly30]|uniref:Anthranilate 1,2-dioxygenase ferredoxin subunit n=1 Tax=Saltatorellus ferox TaxID=2528018 RepID=A0A518ESC9_9BACT|nr:Anthranilate 1,2-dioxygenase ferredoxin subunit [Planctomycetes bacterium Poly30]
MGHSYQAVQWNPNKKRYDALLLVSVVLYLGVFLGVGFVWFPEATAETLLLRALGTAGFLALHVILCIGPLARLDRRWLPLLYNRRHLGVTMATLGLLHGGLALLQFHGFGDVSAFESLFTSNPRWGSLAQFPFQPLGAAALVILVLMAATSHDFWLANLTAPVWKALHMLVYVAYGLLVMHVALGALQVESSPIPLVLLGVGILTVGGLQVLAARKDRQVDGEIGVSPGSDTGWIDVCAIGEIEDGRARLVLASGERIAIFRDGDRYSALSAVCQHQNGPLGEGRIVDGLAVCPWHGFQYRPKCGRSPEPFQEVVPTFPLKIVEERLWLDPTPLPLGDESGSTSGGGIRA